MLFERPKTGEKSVLVHIDLYNADEAEDPEEFRLLADSAGAEPVAFITGKRNAPHARFYVGTGKLDEIRDAVQTQCAELVLFNHALSPGQERNLEKELQCRVLDRTGLILDIFAQRARTHEGKLQVELAQLEHMSTRLIRGWTHLERQKGGIGLRGPGETQLESDRRLLRARIKSIRARLEKVRSQRQQARRSRSRAEIPSVSLVGYTNAGKSTLFNSLSDSAIYAADQLFATLDPTFRRIELPGVGAAILADTVGFIRHLPHKLVESFRATLEEAAEADLLLHVVDSASDERREHIEQVLLVLAEIDADELPILEVYNKTDLLGQPARIDRDDMGTPIRVWLSAQKREGLELLSEAIAERLADNLVEKDLELSPQQGRLLSRFRAMHAITKEAWQDNGNIAITVRLPLADFNREIAHDKATPDPSDTQQTGGYTDKP